jgi:hypothetical protein
MEKRMFQGEYDYQVPILRILADMPNGKASKQLILEEFKRRYGHMIPQAHLEYVSTKTNILKWEHHAAWSRQRLIDGGYLNAPSRGIWQITDRGRSWLTENPNATHIGRIPRSTSGSPTKNATRKSKPDDRLVPAGLSLEMLEKTRKAMGDEHFRPLWGALYDQLVAAERAKAITEVSDIDLLRAARRQVRQIQEYLQGRNGERPTSEQICDWIHFCYQFSLFREAAALGPLVNANEVDPWYFEQARKLAMTAKAKTTG